MKRIETLLILPLALGLLCLFLLSSEAGEPAAKPVQQPNLVIDVSAALINATVQREVDRTDPVQDVIQDTPVSGMARTKGMVWAQLVPDVCHGALDVVLRTQVGALTVGVRPHVLVYTASTTPVMVRHRIVIDAKGIRIFPGPACAETLTCLLDIASRREPDYLAIQFARKGFQRSKDDAEEESACKTAQRSSKRLAEELAPALAAASKSVRHGLKAIKETGLNLESLDFNTTAAFVQARVRIATPGKNPPGPLPELPQERDLGLRIHQSLVNEVAQAELAGTSFPMSEVEKFYDDVTHGILVDARKDGSKDGLKLLDKLLAGLGGQAVKVTLARKNPLTLTFSDQQIAAEILIDSIQQDGKRFAGMRVRAKYHVENSPQGALAVRQGPVQFLPSAELAAPDKKIEPLPVTFLLLRELVFAEILKERLALAALPVPDSMPGRRFSGPQAEARNGWLALAWKLSASKEK